MIWRLLLLYVQYLRCYCLFVRLYCWIEEDLLMLMIEIDKMLIMRLLREYWKEQECNKCDNKYQI
jgi:hypothetical protein